MQRVLMTVHSAFPFHLTGEPITDPSCQESKTTSTLTHPAMPGGERLWAIRYKANAILTMRCDDSQSALKYYKYEFFD